MKEKFINRFNNGYVWNLQYDLAYTILEAINMAIIDIEKSNFEQEVLCSQKPVLIDFFANWCMPCKMLSPIIHEISKEYKELKVCRINVEMEPELASAFRIMSLPTLVYIKDGIVKEQSEGFRNKESIEEMLEECRV